MNKRIQIGAGSKTIDYISLSILAIIFVALLILALIDLKASWLFLIFSLVFLVELIRKSSFYYIFIDGNQLVVENIFKKKIVLQLNEFKEIKKFPYGIPFSNTLIVHFTNGNGYKIVGGMEDVKVLSLQIKKMIRK